MLPPLPPTRVRWKRDWRLRRGLVGPGWLESLDGQLILRGRRTGPLRSLMVVGAWLLAPAVLLGGFLAVTLTGIGLTWRSHDPEWLAWSLLGYLAVLLATLLFAWLLRRVLEPPVRLTLKGEELTALRSDGWQLELGAAGHQGLLARARPSPYTAEARRFLIALQQESSWPAPRSGRLDQGVVLLGLSLAGALAVTAWRHRGPDGPDPVPPRLTAAELDAWIAPCPSGPASAPTLRNRIEGASLIWELEGEAEGWQVASASWRPGEQLRPLSCQGSTCAVEPDHVGLSLLQPAGAAPPDGSLKQALCGVARFDIARALPPEGPRLDLRREGDALVATVDGKARGWRILLARERAASRLDLFNLCEASLDGGEPLLHPASDELRIEDFFAHGRDGARAWLVRARTGRQVSVREAQHCAELDALAWRGEALGPFRYGPPADDLRLRTTDRVRGLSVAAPGADHDAIVSSIRLAHKTLRTELTPSRGQLPSFHQGFLDGLPWGRILGGLSMQHDLPQFERIRQQLSGDDPAGVLGELFLLRLAEELLERVEPQASSYEARIDLALAWRAVEPGTEWEAHGRTVRVPSQEVADYYGVVGHYLLVDLGRRVERQMSRDLLFRVTGMPLRHRLGELGIDIDVEKGSTQKALEAWVTGDFEYLGDRALAKVKEQVADPTQAIERASSASYRLDGQWSADDGSARTAWLLREGERIGWLALYDASKVHVDFQNVAGQGFQREPRSLLALAGSYVTTQGRTAGLSAVDGTVENFLISSSIGGLVAFDRQGRVHMLDMRNGGMLPGLSAPIQPLERLPDLHTLLRWIEDNGASAFQTHLLGVGGALAIDESKASGTLRERHLLVQAAYQGHPIIAVIDLPGTPQVSLFEAAVIAIQALRTPESEGGPGLDVISIANLDVGSYNALEAWNDRGTALNRCPVALGETRNLVQIGRR